MEQKDVLPAGPTGGRQLTRAEIRARLQSRAIGQQGNGTPEQNNIRAAVLVPLIERADGWSVVMTLRSADLADHAGQISLPGGRIDPGDADAQAAALREAEEEIGLPPDHVELVGRLDTWLTGTGFEVTPVVGLVRPPPPYRPDPVEVAEVFEVPLDFILDKRNHQWRSRELAGKQRFFWAIPYLHRNIWGATAGMLVNLADALGT
jgi:8-oxo-dGTP pyrophosphatase MutT (NUDIX family)